ncbi:VOC family protein [Halalkalibacter oceani]|uniref:VOC domain-containing protein n=1 Tax=Halalkalibacter oceani TaxID=1653776 RepID=A0A9X2IQC0_9BACI|nr:hypothetical protein [Halalkalibacter oceani]MCM3715731.1 hypothetical protein [Halalkalibacter oceani]
MKDNNVSALFHHIHLHVDDINSMANLFEKVGSAKFIKRTVVGSKEILHLKFDGVSLLLSPTNGERPPGINHLGISSQEFDKVSEEFREEGWEVIDNLVNNDLRMQFLKSPEGVIIELLEEKQ